MFDPLADEVILAADAGPGIATPGHPDRISFQTGVDTGPPEAERPEEPVVGAR